jgi:hypothetical protein
MISFTVLLSLQNNFLKHLTIPEKVGDILSVKEEIQII